MSVSNVLKQPKLDIGALESGRRRSNVVKRPLLEAKEEAAQILVRAEEEAKALRERAQQEVEILRENAYQKGHESALVQLNEILLEARERRDTALAQAEKDLLTLAIKLAEKIIGREIKRDSKVLADMVANALRNIRQNNVLTIRVNPEDFPLIQEHREHLDPVGRARFLDLVSDPRVSRYGCIIESEFGTVDAQLETQLRVLERALMSRASGNEQ